MEVTANNADSNLTLERVTCGSLQRIADATELMAKSYRQIIQERDTATASVKGCQQRYDLLLRRFRAVKGVVTKLKRKARP